MQHSGKKFLVLLVSYFYLLSYSSAQEQTTQNVVQPVWSGVVTGNYAPQGFSGGNIPAYNPQTNTLIFGYTQATAQQQIVLANVLQAATGLRIIGYNYSWQYLNAELSRGSLAVNISLRSSTNAVLETNTYSLPQVTTWTSVQGTRTYTNPYALTQANSINIQVTGKDDRFWAGYYGPQIKNIDLRVRYTQDECAQNPLSSPECSGYEQAYFQQQCTQNALYSVACPGYQQAYFNQQCASNALWNTQCPGYQQAYFQQQCTQNPLWNQQCPGYQQAYFNQQCTQNPLWNQQCPGYQQAYFNQQCTNNALWNQQCPGYQEAYKAKLFADACQANPQTNTQCIGYKAPQPEKETTVAATTIEPPIPPATQPTQTTSATSPTSVTSVVNPPSTLGTGITVPGVSTSTQPRSNTRQTTSSTREQARQTALQTQQRAEQTADKQQETMAQLATALPGFSAYEQAIIPDAKFYQAKEIYKSVQIQDNLRAQRQLNQRSDRLHREMVDEQYRKQGSQ